MGGRRGEAIRSQATRRRIPPDADGLRLVSTSWDHTALLWDLTRLLTEPGSPVLEPDAVWNDLADADAAKGRRAIELLAGDPTRAVPMLRERLKPVPAPDPKKLA